jgi:hypothetical protein
MLSVSDPCPYLSILIFHGPGPTDPPEIFNLAHGFSAHPESLGFGTVLAASSPLLATVTRRREPAGGAVWGEGKEGS